MSVAVLLNITRQQNSWHNASGLLLALGSERVSAGDKGGVLKALNDWEALTPAWFHVADHLSHIERLQEDVDFPLRSLAALVASKVHYCLANYPDALRCALAAGDAFELTATSCSSVIGQQDQLYVDKMIAQALDSYKEQQVNKELQMSEQAEEAALTSLVNRVFDRNMNNGDYRSVVELALDNRRLDQVEKAIRSAGDDKDALLADTMAKAIELEERAYRNHVLDVLLKIEQTQPDYLRLVQCLIKADDAQQVADLFSRLLGAASDEELLGYQLAFELYENATQQFVGRIVAALQRDLGDEEADDADDEQTTEMTDDLIGDGSQSVSVERAADSQSTSNSTSDESSRRAARPGRQTDGAVEDNTSLSDESLSRLTRILRGDETIAQHMQFLVRNNHTDMLVLKHIKENVRHATGHNAAVIANGFMHAGTTCHDFLKDNLEWIGRATNWNKFNAVASLGMIHRGHEAEVDRILEHHLPRGAGADQFGYKEGGSLYAYGLIHANHGTEPVIKRLKSELKNAQNSNLRHGACLGLGLAAMGTHDSETFFLLRDHLYHDDAVEGEAAGLAMGLTMVGSLNTEAYQEMLQYLRETTHDKIQRGLRLGIALLMYGQMEAAEPYLLDLLAAKSEPILRQTGVYGLAMAYCGTGDADVVRRLLAHVAADPNNDVKRFASIAIGFVLCRDAEQCLTYASMLVEHFNGYVRYGMAMALGIACAGTANKEAIAMIEPMLTAKENYVRQGALISLAFIMIQHTEATCPKVKEFRERLTKVITDKSEDVLAKFGAILAQGIIDAGGRNVTLGLCTRGGQVHMASVVGVLAFSQYWFWHSLCHFLALAFQPTCVIGLNRDLRMPQMEFRSNAKPAMFAYPAPLEENRDKEQTKVQTAVLSIAARARRRPTGDGKKDAPADKPHEKMDLSERPKSPTPATSKLEAEASMDVDAPSADENAAPSPTFQMLQNPARAMQQQLKYLVMPEESRYTPLKPLGQGGIIMMESRQIGGATEAFVEPVKAVLSSEGVATAEAEPPADFEITRSNY